MRWWGAGLGVLLLSLVSCKAQRLPEPYAQLERALSARQLEVLQALSTREGYVRVLAADALAEAAELPSERRAEYALIYARFEDTPAAWVRAARLLEAAGRATEAVQAYGRSLPDAEALRALKRLAQTHPSLRDAVYEALFAGRAYAELLEVLPEGVRPDLRARALYRLGRYVEALPAYQAWARTNARGWLGLGWVLVQLGRWDEALAAFQRYPGPEGRYGEGYVHERQGRLRAAVEAYRNSTPEGRWRAAGLLEAMEATEEALEVYLELARGASVYADDAALRAWVLAQRNGLKSLAESAWERLNGGLGAMVGKPVPLPELSPATPRPPEVLERVWALEASGKRAWALGEVRYALQQERSPEERLALAQALYRLGAYREAVREAERLPLLGREVLELRYPRPYREWVERYAAREGIDPYLIWAVMRVESRFDPQAVSPTGARGLMQFVRLTWEDVARMLGEAPGDPHDPEAAIRYGARYLRWLLDRCSGVLACAVAAYNGGVGYTQRGVTRLGGWWEFMRFQERAEPREYVAKVLEAYAVYRALYRDVRP
ncbi:transglycosylase SLT domain-containing protein [Marinithermus hydrothermalis]|uniref:Lytic transglycosylase catalytic n=1 Tax=Marinithermus hydrothermalis (strain DSM 14884 / JCM 11576 / T1) TaxID=869210 RepID=F2NNV2_MARHT|nr:transglycosylase SLT domain-containing protein [Marinithermus hydrothermalis]AEB11326.1 Lytic transglycosylase catalytic [Marinithermus hydrothermalis DSM 14884]